MTRMHSRSVGSHNAKNSITLAVYCQDICRYRHNITALIYSLRTLGGTNELKVTGRAMIKTHDTGTFWGRNQMRDGHQAYALAIIVAHISVAFISIQMFRIHEALQKMTQASSLATKATHALLEDRYFANLTHRKYYLGVYMSNNIDGLRRHNYLKVAMGDRSKDAGANSDGDSSNAAGGVNTIERGEMDAARTNKPYGVSCPIHLTKAEDDCSSHSKARKEIPFVPKGKKKADMARENSTADTSDSSSFWFGGGIVDMVVNNTSQIASMLQWGESEPPYSLSKETAEVQEMKQRIGKKLEDKSSKQEVAEVEEISYMPCSTVVDTTMYERLGVECTATKAQIKQAYYKLALKYHPDKNPNDEAAKQKFQDIGEAYQILYDETLRQRYDQHGSKAAADFPMMDASIFFMLLFGCEALDDFIGTLKIANLFQYATSDNGGLKNINGFMEIEQNLREVVLAQKLAKRLDEEVIDGKISQSLRKKIVEICSGTFSDTLVESIGWVYENCGDYYVAEATTFWGIGTTLVNIQAAGRSLGNTWSMAKSVVNVAMVVKEIKDDQDQEKTMEKLKYIVENVLSLVLYDVENTVRSAATKCCKDSDVPVDTRLARAKALVKLGRFMQRAAQKYRSGQTETPDVARKMYEAYVKATEKKDEA